MAGFWGSVAGMLFVYYNLFLSPHAISLQQSAEILLMAILGGASSLTGPIVGAAIITLVKNVVSTYVERWNTLLGAIFVIVIVFMPTASCRAASSCGGDCSSRRQAGAESRCLGAAPHDRARARNLAASASASAACRRPENVSLTVMPGERRLIIGPNGAGKTTLFNLITGDLTADSGSVKLFGQELLGMRTRGACISGSRAPTRSSRCSRASRSSTTWCWRCSASTGGAGTPGRC